MIKEKIQAELSEIEREINEQQQYLGKKKKREIETQLKQKYTLEFTEKKQEWEDG